MADRAPPTDPRDPAAPRRVRPRLRAPGAGRPRKSAALHLLHGTRPSPAGRRQPTPADVPVAPADIPPELLTAPDWMHDYAKQFWNRLAPQLAAAGRLKLHHLDAWSALCHTAGKLVREQRAVDRAAVSSEEYALLSKLLAQTDRLFRTGCLRFGIDPATDIRLSAMDGSEVETGRGAAVAPPSATVTDRGDAWLREHGKVS